MKTEKLRFGLLRLILCVVAVWAGSALAAESGVVVSGEEALQKLMDGNKRYVQNQMTGMKLCDLPTRESLAKGQKPYAIILSCADSRVPPEIIFDKGLGELFVVRVAGNIADPVVLGSIEFAAEHFGSPLVMVLGHERCDAVAAAVQAKGKPQGNSGVIVKGISPAVAAVKKKLYECANSKDCPLLSKSQIIEKTIDENARLVSAQLTKQSPIIRKLVAEKKLTIVTAKYDLDDGTVTLLDGSK